MLKKQAGELQDGDADGLFAKGASVKLLASKTDVGSKEMSKVRKSVWHLHVLLQPIFPFL